MPSQGESHLHYKRNLLRGFNVRRVVAKPSTAKFLESAKLTSHGCGFAQGIFSDSTYPQVDSNLIQELGNTLRKGSGVTLSSPP